MDALLASVLGGIVCGLVTWGGIMVELRWLRRDVDIALKRTQRCAMLVQEPTS